MTLAWILFCAYLVGTAWLGWLGHKRTRDFASFAISSRDLHPIVVGITLAASTASAATFIINPGFVYVDGFAAWFHMVIGVGIGFTVMLVVLSFRFRRIGADAGALTIPDWIGKRYGSTAFALYFALINLLAFAFVVLLVGGISIVMQRLLGLTNIQALLLTLTFVTGYVFVGGTYAHVFTNMLQGVLMIVITLVILWTTVDLLMAEDVLGKLRAEDPNLLRLINPQGVLFNDVFSIYVAGFVVGAALVCQPHILTKALYVKTDRDVRRYLVVFTGVFFLFLFLGTIGFFAHLVVPDEALIDAGTGQFRQDLVMTVYLQSLFPDWAFTIVGVVLVAAAMSTLDGLLVGLSTIMANDLMLNVLARVGGLPETSDKQMRLAFIASHIVLVIIAVGAFLINIDPPKHLGVFGQVGAYGMALAAVPPLLAGVLFTRVSLVTVWAASALSLAVHFGLYFYGTELFPDTSLTFANPGVTTAIAMLAVALPGAFFAGRRRAEGCEVT